MSFFFDDSVCHKFFIIARSRLLGFTCEDEVGIVEEILQTFAYSVITNSGVHAIFSGTPSGAGNTDLVHILSGQSIGQSLTGQSVVRHFASSVDGSKLSTGGVLCLNDRGLPVGGCSATNPINLQPKLNGLGGYSVNLNFVARVTTSS